MKNKYKKTLALQRCGNGDNQLYINENYRSNPIIEEKNNVNRIEERFKKTLFGEKYITFNV